MSQRYIDLSHPLSPETPVYPGDEGVEVTIIDSAAPPTVTAPRRLNCSRVAMGVHNGTHLDAPFHFFNDRPSIEALPIADCCGAALVIDLSSTRESGVIDSVDVADPLERLQGRTILLIHTGWDARWRRQDYFTEHPVITRSAAMLISASAVRLVGVDTPSVDRDPFEAHLELLGRGLMIVENLTGLKQLVGRNCRFFAAPLALTGRDASPIRAFAVVDETTY